MDSTAGCWKQPGTGIHDFQLQCHDHIDPSRCPWNTNWNNRHYSSERFPGFFQFVLHCWFDASLYRRNRDLFVEQLIATFDNQQSNGIYLCPINLGIDTVNSMITTTAAPNAEFGYSHSRIPSSASGEPWLLSDS